MSDIFKDMGAPSLRDELFPSRKGGITNVGSAVSKTFFQSSVILTPQPQLSLSHPSGQTPSGRIGHLNSFDFQRFYFARMQAYAD